MPEKKFFGHLPSIAKTNYVDFLQTQPALFYEILEEMSSHSSNVSHLHVRPP